MVHHGYLFEMGSDGYGYVIDESDPGQSYPIQTANIEGLPKRATELEGRKVTFSVENSRVENAVVLSANAQFAVTSA